MYDGSHEIEALVDDAISRGAFPGVVVLVAKAGRTVFSLVKGNRQLYPNEEPLTIDTLFDMASITKPLATTYVTLLVCDQESIDLETEIGNFLPAIAAESGGITLRQLLLHTGGLPPVPDVYRSFPDGNHIDYEEAVRLLLSVRPTVPPGKQVVYSCTGFLLLGQFLRAVTGRRLERLFADLVTEPCGLEDALFNPPRELWSRVAATENCPWRGRWVRGEVHDENSYCFGGDGGNAGLFAGAADVLELFSALGNGGFVNGHRLFSQHQIGLMTTCFTEGMGGRRSIGFLMKADDPPCGPLFSDRSLGHTGFTGTSIWMEPEKKLTVVALTNRVHLGRDETLPKIKEFRKQLHSAVYGNWG